MDLEEQYISSLPSNVLLCKEERANRRLRKRINNQSGQGPLSASEGVTSQNDTEIKLGEIIEMTPIAQLAAACDEPVPHEQEFQAAQRHHFASGERPHTSGSDRHCMVALVKINGLEAYALLDTGSTTISITHDFARVVAKLKIEQLENPVPLQLGTVGSHSMINFGARTQLKLGPVHEDNIYIDVVNIDRYDMIIGTPFMRQHGLVLDFETNALSIRGEPIPILTSGQEDLMLAKKRAWHAHAPANNKGQQSHAQH